MHHPSHPLPRCCRCFSGVCGLTIAVAALLAVGCDFADDDGPEVLAVEIVPSTITKADTADHTGVFEIEISTANFVDEIETGDAFIGNQQRYAEPEEVEVNDNIVYLRGIAHTWFTGMDAGVYDIGVEVDSGTAFTREFNRATVTIEE